MAYDDTLQAHIDACLAETDGTAFALDFDGASGWVAAAGETQATADTAIAACAALLTALRETKDAASA